LALNNKSCSGGEATKKRERQPTLIRKEGHVDTDQVSKLAIILRLLASDPLRVAMENGRLTGTASA